MTDTQQQHSKELETLKNDVCATADGATSYLTSLKKKLEDFDQQHKYGETAAKYMESAISGACDSVAELKQGTKDLTTNQVPKGAVDALMSVKSALDNIQQQARAFDHKFAPSEDKSDTASGMAMKTLEETTNEARQRTMDMVERTQESFNAMQQKAMNVAGDVKTGAQVATGEALRVAEKVDEKVGASGAVGSVIGGVAGTVKAVDSRMHISETAAKVDATVTGGLGARLVNTGVEMAKETLDYVSQTMQHAKAKASKSETVIMAEQKAEGAMEAVQHGMEKMGLTGAAQSTKETTQAAQEKAEEMKDQTMEKGQEMKGQALEKGGQAAEKVGEMKDKTMEGGQQAKDKTSDMKDTVMEKGGEATEMTGEMKDEAMGKAGDMKDKAVEKGCDIKVKTKETAESGKSKTQDTAESAKCGAKEMAESAKETTGMGQGHHSSGHHGKEHHKHHHQGGSMAEQVKDKAQEGLDKIQKAS